MNRCLALAAAAALATALAGPALAQGKKSGFASNAGASSQPAKNTHNQGTTTGPKGALKNDKSTPNTNLPGRYR